MSTVQGLIDSGIVSRDVPLGPLTTYKSGGPARYFAKVERRSQLGDLVASGLTKENKTLVLGRGSNLVVSSRGFDGLVLFLGGEFGQIDIDGVRVVAGAAVPLPKLARTSVEAGLKGLEFFVGVPGSVGGAIRQNAGCFGSETRDWLVGAEIFDLASGQSRWLTTGQFEMGYRRSNVATDDLVVEAEFRAEPGDPSRGREEIRRITRWRRDHQPGGTLNAGSVFKNPADISAGELIDKLGLKGLRVGDVSVSAKHANFFVAGPEATPEEIVELIWLVKDRVLELSGTNLEPEIQLVGFEG